MLNHSCRPTAHHAFRLSQGQPPILVFRSLRALGAGQELCYSYTDLLHPAPLRRAKLAAAYFFQCDCGRCAAWRGGGDREEGPASATAADDRLIERALASPACTTKVGDDGGCPGVLLPVGDGAGGGDEEDEKEEDKRPLRCSTCGIEEAAAGARSRLAVGTALLEARLRALQEEGEEEEQKEEEDGLPGAVRALVDFLLLGRHGEMEEEEEEEEEEEDEEGEEEEALLPSLGLHPQHWLVTQALLALCQRLAPLAKREGASRRVRRMWATAEVRALQSLWLMATSMTGPDGVEENEEEGEEEDEEEGEEEKVVVGRFPELGLRFLAAAHALRLLCEDEDEEGQEEGEKTTLAALFQVGGGGVETFAARLALLKELVGRGGIGALEARGRAILSSVD
jgi:hypothetical protein